MYTLLEMVSLGKGVIRLLPACGLLKFFQHQMHRHNLTRTHLNLTLGQAVPLRGGGHGVGDRTRARSASNFPR